MEKETIQLTSSRKVGMRDINATLSAPISRIKTLRDDEGRNGFTLIELLVVVLIIGILAAIALPQYQKAVEKAQMAEAIINLRAIARAHQLYFLSHGEYVGSQDMNKLDTVLSGPRASNLGAGGIKSKRYVFQPNNSNGNLLAVAHHDNGKGSSFYLFVKQQDPNRIRCWWYTSSTGTSIQQQLCNEINAKGTL